MCCHWFWFHIHPLSIRHFHPSSSAIFIPLHPRSPLSSGLVIDRVASLGASPSRSPFVAISLASSSPFSLHLLTVFLPAPHHLALIWLALCGASAGTPSVGPLLPVRLLSAPHSMPFHRTRLPVLPLIFPFSHQLVTVLPLGPRCLALVWFARCERPLRPPPNGACASLSPSFVHCHTLPPLL